MQRPVRPEDGVVTAFRDGVVTLRSNRRTTGFTEALQEIGYQGIRKGDLVIHAMDAFAGAIGVSDSDGKGTPVYSVCQATGDANSWYYALVLREMSRSGYLLSLAKGIRERSTDFRFADFASLLVPLPPLEEQEQIVRFVRHLDSKVNRLIKAKRRLIELLNEQKQAIIHQAVTRGLDPTVPLKPSGIFWLPEIPEHWKPVRVKSVLLNLNNRRIPLSSPERGQMTIRAFDYYGASGVIDKVDEFIFDDELLLIAEDGANLVLRNLPLAIIARGQFWVNNHAHILKPKHGVLEYWAMLLECVNYMPWISGAAQPKLTKDRIMAVPIPCPPSDEQKAIVESVTLETAGIRLAIDKTKREIDLIREYRTRLVADVVTGQLDVRQHPWANTEIEDSIEAILDGEELEDGLEETDDVLEEVGV